MMNALDGSSLSSLHESSIPANTRMNSAAKPSHLQRNNSRKINAHHPQQKTDAFVADFADANDLPTDVSVTPIFSSDDQSLKNLSSVKATSKDCFEQRVQERNESSVRGALVELQQLQDSFGSRRFLRVPPPSAAAAVGKENRANGPPATGGRPFTALLDSLRKMNPELGGRRGRSVLPAVSSPQFRLLRLPSPQQEHNFWMKLPGLIPSPWPAWNSVDCRPACEEYQPMPATGERFHRMTPSDDDFPLLHLSKDPLPSCGRNSEFSNGLLPFPMLRMVDPHRRQVPFFVPPEEILGRNNNNREALTARSDLPAGRTGSQTGWSDVLSNSQGGIKLLQLEPCLSKADDVTRTDADSRQVCYRLLQILLLLILLRLLLTFCFA